MSEVQPTKDPKGVSAKKKGGFLRRLLFWILIVVLVLGVVIGVGAPLLVPRFAKPMIKEKIEAEINGKVNIGDLSFSWPGSVRVKDFSIDDDRGEKVLSVEELSADVGLFAAIRGQYGATVKVRNPTVIAREDAGGGLNFERLMKRKPAKPASSTSPKTTSGEKSSADSSPEFKGLKIDLDLSGGKASFIAKDGSTTKVEDIHASLKIDSLNSPLSFKAGLKTQASGLVALSGDMQIGANDRVNLDKAKGRVDYKLSNIDLREFEKFIAAVAPIVSLQGQIEGQGSYQLGSLSSINGGGEISVRGLRIEGPAVGKEPLSFKNVSLKDQVALDANGSGRPDIRLKIDDFFDAHVDATIAKDPAGKANYGGKITLRANLAGLSRAAPGLMRLKQGFRMQGDANITGDLAAATESGDLATFASNLLLRLSDLAVFDSTGKPLPMDKELTLDLNAARDVAGLIDLSKCDLKMGQVALNARGKLNPEAKTLGTSFVKADADLDDLATKLQSFMDLPFSFGGKITVDSRLESAGEATRTESMARLTGLRLTNLGGKNLGPIDLVLEQKGTIDLRPGKESRLESFSLTSDALKVTGSGSGKDVSDSALAAYSGQFRIEADPVKLQQQFGDFFGGTILSGQKFIADLQGSKSPASTELRAGLNAPNLQVHGPSFGPAGLVSDNANIALDLAMDGKTSDLNIRLLEVKSGAISATMKDSPRPIDLKNLDLRAVMMRRGDDLDVSNLTIASNLARGGGKVAIKNLMKEGMSANGDLTLEGDVATLLDVVRAYAPDFANATGRGAWKINVTSRTQGQEIVLAPKVQLTKIAIDGVKVGDKIANVQDADIEFASDVTIKTSGTGEAIVRSMKLLAPGVDVSGAGASRGFLGENPAMQNEFQIGGTIDPNEVQRRCSAFLMGYATAGRPLTLQANIQQGPETLVAKGNLKSDDLQITLPPDPAKPGAPRLISQKNLNTDFDITQTSTKGRELLEIRTTKYQSDTATATVQGRISGANMDDADITLDATAELANVLRDFGALMDLKDYDLKGQTTVRASMKGTGGSLKLLGKSTIRNMMASAPGKDGQRVTVSEPEVVLDLNAENNSKTKSLFLEKVTLESTFLRGSVNGKLLNLGTEPEFQNVKGEFSYHPEKLAAVLKPWMPGTMTGTTMESIAFTLQGKARETDWISVLRGSTGNGSVGLAPLAMAGYNVAGNVKVDIKDEQVKTVTALKLNGGDLNIDSNLDLRQREDALSRVQLNLNRGSANREMAPLLSMISPLFAVAEAGSGGAIQGLIDAKLDMTYQGPMTKQTMDAGWDAFPKDRINGKGRIAMSDVVIQGSNLVGQAVQVLGLGDPGRMAMDPLEFTVKSGRVFYDKALKFAMGDFLTAMDGSIGLDKTLDLAWMIPVTDKLVAKHAFLKFWQGQQIKVPIRGTSDAPSLKLEETLADLAKQAIQKEIEQRAGNLIPGVLGGNTKPGEQGTNPLGGAIGDLLGGKKPPEPQPVPPAPQGGNPTPPPPGPGQKPAPTPPGQNPPPPQNQDPLGGLIGGILGGGEEEKKAQQILTDADKLYAEGKKAEAAVLYKKLRDDFKKTDAYKKNKDRIKERESGK